MLLEIYAVVINAQSNTFSLFLRPIILAFKEKEVINYNYTFLEDSDSDTNVDNVPDSELNNIFIKNIIKTSKEDNNTSSQIQLINEDCKLKAGGLLSSSSSTENSSTYSSEKLETMLNNISNNIPGAPVENYKNKNIEEDGEYNDNDNDNDKEDDEYNDKEESEEVELSDTSST